MQQRKAHGMSNGNVNEWAKVRRGAYDFFKLHLKKENLAEDQDLAADKQKLHSFMEEYSEELHTMMSNEEQETWSLVQRTDGWTAAEKLMSSRFVRNNYANFATVSTQILLIHRSGECLVTEHSYQHN